MQIHGKDYVPVSERLKMFHDKFQKGMISTEMIYDGDWVRCKATVTDDVGRIFTGHAEENRKDGLINKTSATENCETSAVGRALGFLGLGSLETVASAEEVISALHKQENTSKTIVETYNEPFNDNQKPCPKCNVGFLVEKKRKDGTGSFLGCDQYPNCKYIESLK